MEDVVLVGVDVVVEAGDLIVRHLYKANLTSLGLIYHFLCSNYSDGSSRTIMGTTSSCECCTAHSILVPVILVLRSDSTTARNYPFSVLRFPSAFSFSSSSFSYYYPTSTSRLFALSTTLRYDHQLLTMRARTLMTSHTLKLTQWN